MQEPGRAGDEPTADGGVVPGAVPRPPGAVPRIRARRLPQPTSSDLLRRGSEIAWAFGRHFAPVFWRQLRHVRRGPLPAAVIGRPLRQSFDDLGGTFIKFGQIMASSPGMFGEDIANELRSCLDTGPPVPFAAVSRRVEDELGMDLSEAFASFDPEPIGQASIAVVHRATLHDGRRVAVKVTRPDIEHLVATDLDLMQPLFELLARQTGEQLAGSMLQLVDGLRVQIGEELDLRNEARSMVYFRRLLAEVDLPNIVVPEPYPALSGANVLTMELLDGVPIDDLAKVADLGVDPLPLVEDVVRAFFLTTVRWGAFHGDLHAGNMLLLPDGRIGIIDWGIVGRLDDDAHWFFIRLIEAVLGDEDAWEDLARHLVRTYGVAISAAVGLDVAGMAKFIRSLVEPTFTRPFGEVSLAAVMQAIQVQVARAHGGGVQPRSLGAIIRRLRFQRRVRRMADEAGGLLSEFDRGTFLLGKQLMYFERYGRLFFSEVALMHDRAFFAQVLAGARPPSAELLERWGDPRAGGTAASAGA